MTSPTAKRSRARSAVSAVVTVVAVAYLSLALRTNWEEISTVSWSPTWFDAATTALFVAAVLVSGLLWGRLLEHLTGTPIANRSAVAVHTQSWLLKYIPGQLGSLGGKVLWGQSKGFKASVMTASFAYEMLFHLVASAALSLPVVFYLYPAAGSQYLGLAALVVGVQLALFAAPTLYRRIQAKKSSKLPARLLPGATTFRLELMYLLPRALNALGFVLITYKLEAIHDISDMFGFGAVYVLAGLLGILAFLVPSGLGVREAVIVALLGPAIGEPTAVVLAATSRILATIADLILVGLLVSVRSWLSLGVTTAQSPKTKPQEA